MFRPLVIYSRFSGTPADGHGHHQVAGYLTPLAYKAAADPNAVPRAARAKGCGRGRRRSSIAATSATRGPIPRIQACRCRTGIVDPAAGRSYAEIAFEGRSQHKTQAQGGIEPRGPIASTLTLVDSSVQAPRPEKSVFDGLDTTIPGLAKLAGLPDGTIRAELAAMDAAAKKALADYEPLDPARIIPALADGLRATRAARAALKSQAGPADAPRRRRLPARRSRRTSSRTRSFAQPKSMSIRWRARKRSSRARSVDVHVRTSSCPPDRA